LTAGLVLAALVVAPASAGTSTLPSGTFLLEFTVFEDDCSHFPFIGDLPESIAIEVGDDGSLILTGPEPWVEVLATVDADGSISGAGLGTVAGFSGVSVLLEGELVEPGVLQGQLTFGAGGELPGSCPIIWQLTLISETPVGPSTSESTTTVPDTTTTTIEVDEGLDTAATTEAPPEDTTTTTTLSLLFAEDDGGLYLWLVTLIVGLMMFAGGLLWWWWLYRTPGGYGPAMVRLLNGLSTDTPDGADREPEETDTETTTDTTTSETTTTTEETTTSDTDTTTTGETTTSDTESEDGDGEQTRDGTGVFGSRTRPPPDCKELVDECERLRAEANRSALEAKRARERAEQAQSRCDDATASAQRSQAHLDDLEPRTEATNYYTRMAWAQQELRDAQGRERDACGDVEEAEANATRAEAARARACLAGAG
jgi:hypothetical protein